MLPAELRTEDAPGRATAAGALEAFGMRIVDVVAPLVPAVKPNIAFFEAFGWEGYRAYMNVVARAKEKGLLVVADAKRGDIGSTAEAYAAALFDEMDVDAVTLSPYLGTDSLAPFFERFDRGKGCFLLVKTSNPSSADLQDRKLDDGTVYEAVADLARSWGEPWIGESGMSSVGAVVGATFPEQAAELRERMPTTPFLLPGYGAQGGKAESLRNAFGPGGSGALVNSSRGIIFAFAKEPYASGFGEDRWEDAVHAATLAMRADLAGAVPDATWAG
jgi:orotidine-5'-phosphate decarboxylase